MNRRDALKGLGSAALVSAAGLSIFVSAATLPNGAPMPLLQGTQDGRVLESTDGGATWRTVAKFGSHTSVTSLRVAGDSVYATVTVGGHPFVLTSKDARTWYTTSR